MSAILTVDVHILDRGAELVGRDARVGAEVVGVQLAHVQTERLAVLADVELVEPVLLRLLRSKCERESLSR